MRGWPWLLACVLLGVALGAESPPPWRPATAVDVETIARRLHLSQRDRFPHQQLSVSADFDGDGRTDLAQVMISGDGSRAGVAITRAADHRNQYLETSRVSELVNLSLDVAAGRPPGAVVVHLEGRNRVFHWRRGRFLAG